MPFIRAMLAQKRTVGTLMTAISNFFYICERLVTMPLANCERKHLNDSNTEKFTCSWKCGHPGMAIDNWFKSGQGNRVGILICFALWINNIKRHLLFFTLPGRRALGPRTEAEGVFDS